MNKPVNEDGYTNNYYHFQNSLTILSQDAKSQCHAMKYTNVAWEIKDETISNGYAVLNTVDIQLSDQQKDRIRQLLENVADIPDAVINVPNSKAAHLQAMGDPCWIPLRAQAKQLLAILSAETERVDAVLNIKRS
jgi:hypothetical protein